MSSSKLKSWKKKRNRGGEQGTFKLSPDRALEGFVSHASNLLERNDVRPTFARLALPQLVDFFACFPEQFLKSAIVHAFRVSPTFNL